jgi:hypothetical protein
MTNEQVVQAQLDAYNGADVAKCCSYYAEDCVIADLNGAVRQANRAELHARYTELFKQFPQNRARLVNRIVVGDTVIDHEDVSRAPGGERFEIIAIYSLKNGLIARCDFAR